ncbi:MAG TPA: hypothetical protein VN253_15575 [Kofleriaceae bacterium]|nr:hypothetical protein [Kofleriaceae bacterium]
MRKASLLLAAAAVVVSLGLGFGLAGCTHDVRARFPSSPQDPTGTLVLLLSQPASNVSVAINGVLVVEDAHTKKLTIDRVPTGTNEIAIAANGSDKAMRAWISSEHPTTIPLGVPEPGMALWKSIVATLVSITAYSLLH